MSSPRVRSLLFVTRAVLFAPSNAAAYPTYHPNQANVGVLPPNQASLPCTTCHVSASGGSGCGFGPCFNPFGVAYRLNGSGWGGVSWWDNHDGDNRTDYDEVQNDWTSPGFPNGASSVFCDMASCAFNGAYACGGNVVCTASRILYATNRSYYTFGFTCAAHTSGTLILGDGNWSGDCADIDECAGNPCGAGSCTQSPLWSWSAPGYTCSCSPGYVSNGTTCVVSDECTTNMDVDCDPVAVCSDPSATIGDYACACPSPTYVGDGRVSGSGCCALGTSRSVPGGACEVVCGDGGRGEGEDCDDGNIEGGDGCSASCTVEPGYICSGLAPGPMSVCVLSCGDQLIDPPETCDDGANNSDTLPNACRTSCMLAYCGDGVVDDGEVCDRGGVLPANADPDACTAEGCAPSAPDAGVDFGGGGGGCAIAPRRDARGPLIVAGLLLALAAVRRRRRA